MHGNHQHQLLVTGYGPGVVASALPSATGHTCLALLLGESCGNFSQFRDGSIICIAGLYKTSNVCMYLDHFVFLFSSLRYSLIKDLRLKTISPTPLTLLAPARRLSVVFHWSLQLFLAPNGSLYILITPYPPSIAMALEYELLSWPAIGIQILVAAVSIAAWSKYTPSISEVPEPFLASFTRLWHIVSIIAGKQNLRLAELHDKHGRVAHLSNDIGDGF